MTVVVVVPLIEPPSMVLLMASVTVAEYELLPVLLTELVLAPVTRLVEFWMLAVNVP